MSNTKWLLISKRGRWQSNIKTFRGLQTITSFHFSDAPGGSKCRSCSLGFGSSKLPPGICSFIVPSCGCFSLCSNTLPELTWPREAPWFRQDSVKMAEESLAGWWWQNTSTVCWGGVRAGTAEELPTSRGGGMRRMQACSQEAGWGEPYPLGLWPHWLIQTHTALIPGKKGSR